jgi:chromosome segregation ATPase
MNEEESKDQLIAELRAQLATKEALFEEVQQTTKQYEQDLESEIQRLESQCRQTDSELHQARSEIDTLKTKVQDQQKSLTQVQEEVVRIQQEREGMQVKLLELELRHESTCEMLRQQQARAADLEMKYNQQLEKQALIDGEIETYKMLEVELQRRTDELRHASEEIDVLKRGDANNEMVTTTVTMNGHVGSNAAYSSDELKRLVAELVLNTKVGRLFRFTHFIM